HLSLSPPSTRSTSRAQLRVYSVESRRTPADSNAGNHAEAIGHRRPPAGFGTKRSQVQILSPRPAERPSDQRKRRGRRVFFAVPGGCGTRGVPVERCPPLPDS